MSGSINYLTLTDEAAALRSRPTSFSEIGTLAALAPRARLSDNAAQMWNFSRLGKGRGSSTLGIPQLVVEEEEREGELLNCHPRNHERSSFQFVKDSKAVQRRTFSVTILQVLQAEK